MKPGCPCDMSKVKQVMKREQSEKTAQVKVWSPARGWVQGGGNEQKSLEISEDLREQALK